MEKKVGTGGTVLGGNTKPLAKKPKVKRESAVNRWCFTYNNYTIETIGTLVQSFNQSKDKYYFSEEIGEEKETPHLQGYVETFKRKRLSNMKEYGSTIHWERAKGSKIQNIDYCSKDPSAKRYTNFRMAKEIKFPVMNKPWQLEILDIIKTEPDERTIHWYWSKEGGVGKTTFIKYLKQNHFAISCPAKSGDALHRIAKMLEAKELVDLIVFNIPRDSICWINYNTIETIKDGDIVSGKYEGFDGIMACPHVFIFANEKPDTTRMSKDRWHIVNIDE